jgi:outer membrane protein assembly factor BamB
VVWKREQDSIESDVLGVGTNAVGQIWNGDLVALSLETGALVWKVSVDEHLYSYNRIIAPARWNGRVYFGGRDGNVYAVDGETGTLLWKTDLKSKINTTPAVSAEGVYVGTEDGQVPSADIPSASRSWPGVGW